MEEIWKDVVGYEGYYQVSNLGRVKSLDRVVNSSIKNNDEVTKKGKLLNIYLDSKEKMTYYYVKLSKENMVKRKYIHRLVAEAFIPNPNNYPVVNHIDGNKQNNNVTNLEWCTSMYNTQHAFKNGLVNIKKGKGNHLSIPINQYDLNGNFIKQWDCTMDIQRKLGFYHSSITSCCKHNYGFKTAYGYKWEYVKRDNIIDADWEEKDE